MTMIDVRPSTLTPIYPFRLAELATELAADRSRWPSDVRFDEQKRWYGRVSTDSPVEAWLLTWLPGQSTGLHDHGETAGAFVVVEGVLQETKVMPHPEGGLRDVTRRFGAGRVRPFSSWHVHDLVNAGTVPAISLHVYAPGLAMTRRYRRQHGRLVQVSVQWAGEDW